MFSIFYKIERFNEVEIYSCSQLEGIKQEVVRPVLSTTKVFVTVKPEPKEVKCIWNHSARPQPATSKIFAPRTEDMNKGFLMFSDDDSGFTMLKDEPEDLTHLAPTAGDVCVPLSNPLMNQMFDSLMVPLADNYCPLINEDKDTPFFASYRDDLSSGSLSPTLSQSPGGGSLPSLCSMGDDSSRFEDTTMKTLLGLNQTLDIVDPDCDDLTVKAPYIPMSEGDDLPLLMNSDFMWAVNFPSPNSSASNSSCSPSPAPEACNENSSLANLLKADAKKSIVKQQDQGGGEKTTTLVINTSLTSQIIGDIERRKRSSTIEPENPKKRKQQSVSGRDSPSGNSVLMNLLVAGCDVSAGYICLNPRKSSVSSKLPPELKRNS